MEFKFPRLDGTEFEVPIEPGHAVFVIGPNGSGKSGLMHRLYVANRDIARRATAHRQTWFRSNALDLSALAKKTTEQNMRSWDQQPDSRWLDPAPDKRASVTIYDLIDAVNVRARNISNAVDAKDMAMASELGKKKSALTILNQLLETANLPIVISIEKGEQVFASKNGGDPYSIAKLSDGERNAVLIASMVLTADEGSLIIIDEPERHLHRSIVSPLLLSLFGERDDCGFVISTHEVSLPADSLDSSTLLLRACAWGEETAAGWDADLLTPDAAVPDDVRLAILGARRKILFVEGQHDSLDKHIYSILFPSVSVRPSGNCTEVTRAVTGIRGSQDLHWVRAFGLVDRDDRDQAAVGALAAQNVYALDCYSVESLYYCNDVMQKIAERQGQTADDLADLDAARQAIVDEVEPHRDRLCARLIERCARTAVMSDLPSHQSLQQNPVHTSTFDATGLLAAEQARFDGLVAASDIDSLVSRYPVRETGALGKVATDLGFKDRQDYESAVRKLLTDDEEARDAVKQKLGAMTAAIEA